MSIHQRIKAFRESRQITHQQFADAVGVSRGAVQQWERGLTAPARKKLPEVAAFMGVSLSELLAETDAQNVPRMALGGIFPSPTPIEMENNPDYPAVRRVSVKAQAGVTGYAVEDIEDGPPIVFRKDWYTSRNFTPEKMLAMRVHGESMMPSLYPGDLIVMNTAQAQPKDGIAFVVAYEGEVVVKRMVRDDGSWWLCSDNPDQRRYPRKKCNGDTQIIGEVVYRQTERI